MRGVTVASCLLLAASCSQPSPPIPPDSRNRPIEAARHTPSDRTTLLNELERQFERWLDARPSSYQLTVSRLCLCDPGVPWISKVEGLVVLYSSGGHQGDGRSTGPALRTVTQLFTEAERAARSDADEVEVAFDARFGYPTRIHIDPWRNSADDETEYIATLEVLTID